MKVQQLSEKASKASELYGEFDQLNGEHSFKKAVPDGNVEYQVRTRHGGKVVYFNFALAKEMGLLPSDHPETMNDRLERKLLDTFSLVIINEYDIHKKIKYLDKEIRPNRYMATRYLQLQHPNKKGKTSGDGRGIWNGEFRGRGGITWDVTSSGTGATCLSPAAAQRGRYFKTGDQRVGYGNGYNTLDEGLAAALMSEIFHQNGTRTERTLVIIGTSGGTSGLPGSVKDSSINVRAGHNLMRPSHFFCHLRQNQLAALKNAVNYYCSRQMKNGHFPSSLRGEQKYKYFSETIARTFARSAAQFECEYIFCWMDWDGDNILADGGIIDYGSVRLFGMYYGDYQYDDVDRYSTRLPEQRLKARYIVQCFAQIRDFLVSGRKKNIHRFRHDPTLKIFDEEFEKVYQLSLLAKVGFSEKQRQKLLSRNPELVRAFRKVFNYFERVRSKKGVYTVPDGRNCDAVFSMRDLLREYPRTLMNKKTVNPSDFVRLMATPGAHRKDRVLSPFRERRIQEFQTLYQKLISEISESSGDSSSSRRVLLELMMRSSLINKRDRITGDAAVIVTENLIRWHRRVPPRILHEAFHALVKHQHFKPTPRKGAKEFELPHRRSKAGAILEQNLRVIRKYRKSV